MEENELCLRGQLAHPGTHFRILLYLSLKLFLGLLKVLLGQDFVFLSHFTHDFPEV